MSGMFKLPQSNTYRRTDFGGCALRCCAPPEAARARLASMIAVKILYFVITPPGGWASINIREPTTETQRHKSPCLCVSVVGSPLTYQGRRAYDANRGILT